MKTVSAFKESQDATEKRQSRLQYCTFSFSCSCALCFLLSLFIVDLSRLTECESHLLNGQLIVSKLLLFSPLPLVAICTVHTREQFSSLNFLHYFLTQEERDRETAKSLHHTLNALMVSKWLNISCSHQLQPVFSFASRVSCDLVVSFTR